MALGTSNNIFLKSQISLFVFFLATPKPSLILTYVVSASRKSQARNTSVAWTLCMDSWVCHRDHVFNSEWGLAFIPVCTVVQHTPLGPEIKQGNKSHTSLPPAPPTPHPVSHFPSLLPVSPTFPHSHTTCVSDLRGPDHSRADLNTTPSCLLRSGLTSTPNPKRIPPETPTGLKHHWLPVSTGGGREVLRNGNWDM